MMIRFHVQNYKALRDATLELTPVHLLIGPNDSGKTSLLEAVAALCRSVDHPLSQAFAGSWEGRSLVWKGNPDVPVSLRAAIQSGEMELEYHLSCQFASTGRQVHVCQEEAVRGSDILDLRGQSGHASRVLRTAVQNEAASDEITCAARLVHDALAGVHTYRWTPSFLGLPVAPDSKRRFRMDPSGFGLALCLDDILGFDRERFIRLETRFKEIFPHIESVKLIPEPAFRAPPDDPLQIPFLQRAEGKGIWLQFVTGGELVPASQVSDGILLILAYLTALYLPEPPRVILVEEPENGIHPGRLNDVLAILRDLVREQSHTQLILTTHSPYVVDLFAPEDVTLCRRENDGSVSAHRLSESKTVREQLDVFTLGEIWTAEGDEALSESVHLRMGTGR